MFLLVAASRSIEEAVRSAIKFHGRYQKPLRMLRAMMGERVNPVVHLWSGASEVPGRMVEDSFEWEGSLQEVTQRAVEHVERFKIQPALREFK